MDENRLYNWYDSLWLQVYAEAREIIRSHRPGKLAEFEDAFRVFLCPTTFKTQHHNDFLDSNKLAELNAVAGQLAQSTLDDYEMLTFGRFLKHDVPAFNQLQCELIDVVSDLCGETVEPGYNFLSLYNNLGICDLHMDAPSAKWTLDLCLDQSAEWPIRISDVVAWPDPSEATGNLPEQLAARGIQFEEHTMHPGDALLFSGTNQWHYRDRIPRKASQNYCHLLFLHYIPKGSGPLLNPMNWFELFAFQDLEPLVTRMDDIAAAFPDSWALLDFYERRPAELTESTVRG